ncbi:hypothetical protein HNY73_017273 [Argiope bruennichi]|uniref:Uncharacterized protein n=1 Tax=Argiope bruennichi TaxID=94029 RepID=A0A8T0EMV6_ARGBR|nr:hypothetical protein HNY73_017273 [Argiope bruennichi]
MLPVSNTLLLHGCELLEYFLTLTVCTHSAHKTGKYRAIFSADNALFGCKCHRKIRQLTMILLSFGYCLNPISLQMPTSCPRMHTDSNEKQMKFLEYVFLTQHEEHILTELPHLPKVMQM